MLNLLLAVALCALAHLLVTAAACRAAGLVVREFSFGLGPTWLRVGTVRLRLLPVGGAVSFGDPHKHGSSLDLGADDSAQALAARPVLAQLEVMLAGCAVLLAAAAWALGADAWRAFIETPLQVASGAWSPLTTGADQVGHVVARVQAPPFATLLGLMAAKVAALNLLPLAGTNGAAVLALLGRRLGAAAWWRPQLATAWVVGSLAVPAAWVVAVGACLLRG